MAEMCKAGLHPWIPENIGSNGPGKQTCKPCRNESRARHKRPKCEVDGCDRDRRVRVWCSTHYERWRIHGDPLHVAMTGEEMVEEIIWLLEGGMTTFYISQALNRDREVLARLLYRHNRHDLAVRFGRVEEAA